MERAVPSSYVKSFTKTFRFFRQALTRKRYTTIIYHGGFQRWKSVRIAAIELRWKSNWDVSYRGECLTQQIFG